MSFSVEVIVWCFVLPAIVAGVGAFIGRRLLERRGRGESAAACWCGIDFGVWTVAAGVWGGLAVALAARQWISAEVPWPQRLQGVEAWQSAVWPLLLFTLIPQSTRETRSGTRYVAATVIACLLAFLTLPTGDSWGDLMDLHRPWSALIVTSVLLNAFALDELFRSDAKVWPLLVLIAGLAPAFLLGSLTYAAPAEWTLAGLAVTLGVFLVAGWAAIGKSSRVDGTVVAKVSSAATLLIAGMIATAVTTARFYTWEQYPMWLYAIALFLPAVVAMVDWPLRRFDGRVRVPVAASVSVILIALCVWKLLLQEPAESW